VESVVVLKVSVVVKVQSVESVQVSVVSHSMTVLPSMVVHHADVGDELLKVGSVDGIVIVVVYYEPLELVKVTVEVLSVISVVVV